MNWSGPAAKAEAEKNVDDHQDKAERQADISRCDESRPYLSAKERSQKNREEGKQAQNGEADGGNEQDETRTSAPFPGRAAGVVVGWLRRPGILFHIASSVQEPSGPNPPRATGILLRQTFPRARPTE